MLVPVVPVNFLVLVQIDKRRNLQVSISLIHIWENMVAAVMPELPDPGAEPLYTEYHRENKAVNLSVARYTMVRSIMPKVDTHYKARPPEYYI